MLKMGYQGMYIGDNLGNKIIPDELAIYAENLLKNITTIPASGFKELKESAKDATGAVI
jgi:hypothetical protein